MRWLPHGWGVIEYRPILGFPDYLVSNEGEVLSKRKTGGFVRLNLQTSSKGYKTTKLTKEVGVAFTFYVHKLVLETFISPRPEGMQVRHLNGIPDDNRVENLAWGTAKDNQHDKERHGTHVPPPVRPGEKHEGAVLTDAKVRYILNSNESQKDLAVRFHVSRSLVSMVKNRIRWGHVASCPEEN